MRVIYIAEAEEQVIALIKIDIHTGVEGVAEFRALRGIAEIAENAGIRWIWVEIEKLNGVGIQAAGGDYIKSARRGVRQGEAGGAGARAV